MTITVLSYSSDVSLGYVGAWYQVQAEVDNIIGIFDQLFKRSN